MKNIFTQDLKTVQQSIQQSVKAQGKINLFKEELLLHIPKDGKVYGELRSCIF